MWIDEEIPPKELIELAMEQWAQDTEKEHFSNQKQKDEYVEEDY